MLHKFIRYIRGYLRIRISGNAVERFLNTCSYKNICLWNLTSCQSKYELNISVNDFRKLKPVIRKTRTKVSIVERTGFPFFLQKFKSRRLIYIGFFLCIILIYTMSFHIWGIKISGNKHNTNENLLDFLETLNVETGMKRSNVNCRHIAWEIRKAYDDIIWVSASVEGSTLILQIKENEDSFPSDIQSEKTSEIPYDLISDYSCQITDIVIRNGVSLVKEGDYVNKGDLIVSGQIPIYNDAKEITNYNFCTADADIYGKITSLYEDEISITYYKKNFSDIKKQIYSLKIGKWRFTLGDKKNNYKHFEEYSYQRTFKNISFCVQQLAPYEQTPENYSRNDIQKILSDNFSYYCTQLEKKGVEIIQNDVKIYSWSDKAKATGYITVKMPVGQLRKSRLINITGEDIDGNDGNNN